MPSTTARVPTANASKYLQQLCKHWAHKLDVEFTPEKGTVRFESAVATLAAEADALVVELTAEDAPMVERMKEVLSSHLDRFAFKEARLTYEWT